MLLSTNVVDLHLLLINLAGDVALLHIVLVDHACLLLNLIQDVLFLLLEGLILLLFLLDVIFNSLSVCLELLKVGLQVLNGFAEVLVTLANSNRFITIFHVLTLQGLNLVFVLFFVFLHDEKLAFEIPVLSLFLLNS